MCLYVDVSRDKRDICQRSLACSTLQSATGRRRVIQVRAHTRTTLEIDSRVISTGAAVRIDGEGEMSVERVQEAGTSL